jgi:pimeloyl-ACP methyl ester carboxylesterase
MDMAMSLGPNVFIAQSESLRTRQDLSGVLHDTEHPVFLACGAEDRLCPPAWHEAARAACADAELHVIRGAGHMLPLERPAALAGALLPWLQALDPA